MEKRNIAEKRANSGALAGGSAEKRERRGGGHGENAEMSSLRSELEASRAETAELVATIYDLRTDSSTRSNLFETMKAQLQGAEAELAKSRPASRPVRIKPILDRAGNPVPVANVPSTFDLLKYYQQNHCVARPEEEGELKRVWARTLAILSVKAEKDGVGRLPDVLAEKGVKLILWNFLAVDHLVDLPLHVVRTATAPPHCEGRFDARNARRIPSKEYEWTIENLLAKDPEGPPRRAGWSCECGMPGEIQSAIVGVPAGSTVVTLEVASPDPFHERMLEWHADDGGYEGGTRQMRVDEYDQDSLDTANILPWGSYGRLKLRGKPDEIYDCGNHYSEAEKVSRSMDNVDSDTFAIKTKATMFTLSVAVIGEYNEDGTIIVNVKRQRCRDEIRGTCSGISIFRARGILRSPPTPAN